MKVPRLTIDAIIKRKDGSIVLIKRKNDPFKGMHALPGGFVEYGETVEQAVLREVKEETGLEVKILKLLGVYSDPKRDPRGHTVAVAFLCTEIGGELRAGDDAAGASSFKIIPDKLAFDHRNILKDAGY